MYKWTDKFYGVSHYCNKNVPMTKQHWATINEYPSVTILTKWYPGDPLAHNREETFDTTQEAMIAGEKFVHEHEKMT